MRKFIFSVIMMVAVALSAQAQQTTVEGSKILDNTSVSVYVGAMNWINPSVTNSSTFINGTRPEVGIRLGKWFTPTVGIEAFAEGSFNSLPFDSKTNRWSMIDMSNIGVNGKVNLNNLFHHYTGQPDRVEVVPFAGIGWAHGYTTYPGTNISAIAGTNAANFLSANMGASVDFNLGSARAWQINVRPGISYMLAGEGNPVQFNSQRAYTSLQVGFTYKFGHKNSKGVKTHNFTSAYTVAEYETLQNQEPKVVEKTVEKVVEKTVEKEVPVETVKNVTELRDPHFVQNRAIVDATSVSMLDDLATEMKSNSDNYTLTGYASTEGEDDYNQTLSLKRAEAIKKCLIDRGVAADRLTTVAGGETDKFGESLEANRRVVIEKK